MATHSPDVLRTGFSALVRIELVAVDQDPTGSVHDQARVMPSLGTYGSLTTTSQHWPNLTSRVL